MACTPETQNFYLKWSFVADEGNGPPVSALGGRREVVVVRSGKLDSGLVLGAAADRRLTENNEHKEKITCLNSVRFLQGPGG